MTVRLTFLRLPAQDRAIYIASMTSTSLHTVVVIILSPSP